MQLLQKPRIYLPAFPYLDLNTLLREKHLAACLPARVCVLSPHMVARWAGGVTSGKSSRSERRAR